MSFFRHPNPAKLAANQDMHGLVDCVTGKDQAIAKQAAPLLAALVDDFDEAPGTHEVLRDLEGDAQPMAVYALVCILRHGFDRSSHVKSSAAVALYRLHATDDLKRIFEELRNSDHKGKKLHADLSRAVLGATVRAHDAAMTAFLLRNSDHKGKKLHADLSRAVLGATVRAHDAAMTAFLLRNGEFSSAAEVAPAFELLRSSGGPAAVEAVTGDASTFSSAAKEAGQAALGRAAETPRSPG